MSKYICNSCEPVIGQDEGGMYTDSGYKDTYTITWHIDDVREVASDLSDSQCREVLYLACERRHDANIGVNWEVLEYWADYVRKNQS